MRLKILWPVGLMAVVLIQAHGQPPSGVPQSFRGGFPQDMSKAERNERERHEKFDRYSEGRAVWDRSRLTDPKEVKRFDEMAEKLGSTSNIITRQQYLGYYEQRDQQRDQSNGFSRDQGNGFSRDQGNGYSRGGFGGPPMTMTMPGNAPTTSPTSPAGTDGRSRFGSGQPGGMSSWMDRRFREYDKNGDGILSNDEIPDTMRNERSQWDSNGNGFIDLNEYTSFFQARMQQMQAERAGNGTNGPGGFNKSGTGDSFSTANPSAGRNGSDRGSFDMSSMRGGDRSPSRGPDNASMNRFDPNMMRGMDRGGMNFSRQREPEPPPRPTVYRPGNLPRDLPSWFTQRDTDNDGQVALYEWRAGGSPLSEFQQLDANNDGFVTVEEALRHQAAAQRNGTTNGTADPPVVVSTSPREFGGRGSFGSRGNGRGSSPPSPDFTTVRPGVSGPDRERMMEMMNRARENYLRNGGAPPSAAEFLREMTAGSSPSGERGAYGKGRSPAGNGNGNGDSPRKGRSPGGGDR